MPRPVVPIFLPASSFSSRPSTRACSSRLTWARSLTRRFLRACVSPLASRAASSLKKAWTLKTTPEPIRLVHWGLTRPDGRRWKLCDARSMVVHKKYVTRGCIALVGHAIGTADTVN